MIDDKKYHEILDDGLTLDHYVLLCNIKNGVKSLGNKRIQGFLNLLIKKGYIENDELTEKGIDLVENCDFPKIIEEKGESIALTTRIGRMHKKCEDKIFELTGLRQVRASIKKDAKTSIAFLCNVRDFSAKIQKAMKLYRLKDYDKIERTLINHIERCHAIDNWFPLMHYYILKDNFSQMVTDLESEGKEEPAVKESRHKLL